ncbi:MAG: ATP-binding cassette domain-containing protein [Nitrospirae bacterium]|nr:ATP-binding cassette domain-containing protein [Nitrospirota bacterium]MBI3351415.1 ATP-binding cassette domain-containing protein [Nitrospirota bacterium]
MNMITVKHLRKEYRLKNRVVLAVKDLSFTVQAGEVFGFLGPNGAGKTSTINMLCTLLKPSGGEIFLNQFNVVEFPHAVRKSIGVVFQDPSLDEKLTAWENLDFHARLYNIPKKLKIERMAMLLKLTGLEERKNDLINTFSGGMKRRLEIARGLLHFPRVLFLDEPTLGLDPQSRAHIWGYIHELKERENLTIFLTTHYMDEAEHCGRIAIMDHGEMIALETPHDLKKKTSGDHVLFKTADAEKAKKFIEEKYQLEVTEEDGSLLFEIGMGEEFLPRFIKEAPFEITSINVRRPTLDDVFLNLTGHSIRPEDADRRTLMRARHRIKGRRLE